MVRSAKGRAICSADRCRRCGCVSFSTPPMAVARMSTSSRSPRAPSPDLRFFKSSVISICCNATVVLRRLTVINSSLCNPVKEALISQTRGSCSPCLECQMLSRAEPRAPLSMRGAGIFDRIDYRLIESPEDRDSICALRDKGYLYGGLISELESQRVTDPYD